MRVKSFVLILLLLFILVSCGNKECQGVIFEDECLLYDELDEEDGLGYRNFIYDDIKRTYIFYRPITLHENSPVVVVLHGFGSSAFDVQYMTGMNYLADQDSFSVVYPEAMKVDGQRSWNADMTIHDYDDTGYILALLEYLQERHNISNENLFVMGYSNGGFMVYTLACSTDGVFEGMAVYAGLMSNATWESCNNPSPMNILHIHGDDDQIVKIDGTMSTEAGMGGAPDLTTQITFWRNHMNLPDVTETVLSDRVRSYMYFGPSNDYMFKYISIENQLHTWPEDNELFEDEDSTSEVSQLIWDFFKGLLN